MQHTSSRTTPFKSLFLFGICCASCLFSRSQVTPPYVNSFEGPTATTGWSHYALSGTDDWEIGYPTGTYFNAPFSGDSAWATTLNGTYVSNSVRCLETPEFDLTNTTVDYAFSIRNKRHETGSGTTWKIEYSVDGGLSWLILYNSSAQKKSWQGSSGYLGNYYSIYQESVISLSWLQGQNVRFRFRFDSVNGGGDGWLLDDFYIKEAEYNVTAGQGDTIKGVNQNFTEFDIVSPFYFQNQYLVSYPFECEYYFSPDPVWDLSDALLGTTTIGTSGSLPTMTTTLPLPTGLNAGVYYIIYKFDTQNALTETNELDNENFAVLLLDSLYLGNYVSDLHSNVVNWTGSTLGAPYEWNLGNPNNWHIEEAKSGANCFYTPEDHSQPQYIESPFIDLSAASNTTLCFWYKNSKQILYPTIPVSVVLPQSGQPTTTYPNWSTSPIPIVKPRLYTWDCYCVDISQLDGEPSTKIRFMGSGDPIPTNLDETAIDDIYIGEAKGDVAIEGFKENRFTSSSNVTDTLKYLFFNAGLTSIGTSTTNFFWSTDSILDGGDIFLGSKSEPSMADTSFQWEKFEYTKPTLAVGSYFIIYQADINNDVDEMREYDNSGYFKISQEQSASLPYYNDFESQINGWYHNSTFGVDDWVWGIPTGSYIDTAFSGVKAFITNDTGIVSQKSRMHLFTPIFDLTQLNHPVLEFDLLYKNYTVGGFGYWPYNMGNMMYSVDGGASWELLDTASQSFKRMYYKFEYESNPGTDVLQTNGTADIEGELLYGRHLKIFRNQEDYQTRDYDDNHHFVLDLDFLKDFTQVQFMCVYSNHNSPMEGMLMDNFEISEAKTDLMIPTEKKLMVDKDDQQIKFYFKIKNNENYISDPSSVNIYCSQDTLLDGSDPLVHTEQIGIIRPYCNELAVILTDVPSNYGIYSYVLCEIDPSDIVTESDELNNIHYFDLAMDSCENYNYPVLFDFEDQYIDGWTWHHDSSGYYHGQRFRHIELINDPVVDNQSGEWFLDVFNGTGYSAYPFHFLEAPAFDFSNLADIHLSFDFFCLGGNSPKQGGNFEYSIDGGQTWTVLTYTQDPLAVNWYNQSQIQSLNNEPGWGVLFPNSLDWRTAEYNLSFLAGEPNVRFRFKFRSQHSVNLTSPMGFRLDNFKIEGLDGDLKTDFHYVPVSADITQPHFFVNYDIENTTSTDILISTTKIYWSEDSLFDGTDVQLYDIPEASIPANSVVSIPWNIYYPLPITQYTYWLFYDIDANDNVVEVNELNNIGSFKITFNDLSSIDLEAIPQNNVIQTSGAPGFFTFYYDLLNNGTIESPTSMTEVFWSTDSLLDVSDLLLYSYSEGSVQAMGTEPRSGDIYFPGPVAQPEYFLILEVDATDLNIESDEVNNLTLVKVSFSDVGLDKNQLNGLKIWYSDDKIYVQNETKTNDGDITYYLYNGLGKVISTQVLQVPNDNEITVIPLNNLSAGIYLIQFEKSGNYSLLKFYHD